VDYPYQDKVRPDLLKMIPSDGKVIGSIGCGTGATEAELVRQGREVHGVDVAEVAIELARPRLTSARLVAMDCRDPFAPASLDGLILADVIEHIPSAWTALADFSRAVRPGGWVVISVPNMRSLKGAFWFLVKGDWPEDPTGIFDATHLQVMTHRRLARWCNAAGLVPEAWFGRYFSLGTRKGQLLAAFDALTFRAFTTWFTSQVQVRCRVRTPSGGSPSQPTPVSNANLSE
jgi:2-polyprenyl-3-methyl-5-hydroxy-6-metoxy-1,4-benzoquinol methylase